MATQSANRDGTTEADDEIKVLHYQRGNIKAKLTRFWKYLDNADNHTNVAQIRIRLQVIEDAFNTFESIQSSLELRDENEEKERDAIENSFYGVIAYARELLDDHANEITSNNANAANTGNASVNASNELKLPTVSLPNFNGSYDNWVSFRDTFESLIHNRNIPDIQKLFYLKSCLSGEALRVIESIQVTAANYVVAWRSLKERYNNKRAIVKTHVRALFELPLVARNSYKSLRQLTDKVTQQLAVLNILGLPTKEWDCLIIHLIFTKLDNAIQGEFENTLQGDNLPTLKQLLDFLTKKCFILENLHDNQNVNKAYGSTRTSTQTQFTKLTKNTQQSLATVTETTQAIHCAYCNNDHQIYNCPKFAALSIKERYEEIRKLKLCSNCLRRGHFKNECNSARCKKCTLKHNTLLHMDHYKPTFVDKDDNKKSEVKVNNVATIQQEIKDEIQTSLQTHNIEVHAENCNLSNVKSQILLSTVQLLIKDEQGNWQTCRGLCDSGSQSNFITKRLQERLNLDCQNVNIPVAGINQNVTKITQSARTAIKSRFNSYQADLTFLIVPTITRKLPIIEFDDKLIEFPQNLQIADPEFNVSRDIDILLGVTIFYDLLSTGQIKLGKNKPVFQNTKLGWIISGNLDIANKFSDTLVLCNHYVTNEALDEHLTKFWKIEDLPSQTTLTPEERLCEEVFEETTVRDDEGRFHVKLPFLDNIKDLGDSRMTAVKRFKSIEKKFKESEELRNEYHKFIKEYEELKHMTRQGYLEDEKEENGYYLPHHAVIKESSTTTRCRVVFDASCKTDTGISLNETLAAGPKIQDDLFDIVLRLRMHKYVLNADIKMMFRQVKIHEDQRKYQKIIWRYSEDEPYQIYVLNTITYGMTSSPYLAQKCLQRLAKEFETTYPQACKIIRNSFYMDDLLVSVETKEEALRLQRELTEIMNTAGFNLRKWSSNEEEILEAIERENEPQEKLVERHKDKDIKTLGIRWQGNSDTLRYTVNVTTNLIITKRTILSIICQIFDPLGLISPVIVKAKLIMQALWQLKIGWDEEIPQELREGWQRFLKMIESLNEVRINRRIACDEPLKIELHGYSDASEKAFGACLYMCTTDRNGKRHTQLICAKSRVAPLKKQTLPRLELMAALLLAELSFNVERILGISFTQIKHYTDSTITLAWIKTDPSRLKTFVANRVTRINEITKMESWNYVRSKSNPADMVSRGVDAEELKESEKWWHGPRLEVEEEETKVELPIDDIPETKPITVTFTNTKAKEKLELFDRYSSFTKLQRIVAYCLRVKDKAKGKGHNTKTLNTMELERSLFALVKIAQTEDYQTEINCLKNGKPLSNKSKILNLNPFIDENNILRVGGRLTNANVSYEQRHPIILSSSNKLTKLIVRHYHLMNLHAGTQTLLAIIRLKFWPVHGKNLVKQIIRNCVTCFKIAPKPTRFLMGNLPLKRVNVNRPFSKCGVDYAGPIFIKNCNSKARKFKLIKAYICVFVCFTTKAIHLDLATDLSTEGFIRVLNRFISRRGKPHDIFTDNATNFVGTSNLLEAHNERISKFLASHQITWHFIPPRSPHVGGLWEAAVKSVKFHLKRVLKDSHLDFENLYTVLVQIEAILNSRPITPISEDINDYNPLTPAHFLIMDSLAASPQGENIENSACTLKIYEKRKEILKIFWKRWQRDYLTQLQQRNKWKSPASREPEVGDLVLLMDSTLGQSHWPLARILEIHPGNDGTTRVVTVRSPNGTTYKRTLAKIALLPKGEL